MKTCQILKRVISIFFLSIFLILKVFSICLAKEDTLYPTLYIDLELTSSSIEGSLEVKLLPKKTYQFDIRDLEIGEILLNEKRLSTISKNTLNILTTEGQNTLFIKFEKPLNYHVLPFNLVTNFFPLPDSPFKYQIILRVPKKLKVHPLIPSDEFIKKEEENHTVYTFYKNFPHLNPCLIISKEKLEGLKLEFENLNIFLYRTSTGKKVEFDQVIKTFEKTKKQIKNLETIGNKGYPFTNLFVFVDENFERELRFSNTILSSYGDLNSSKRIILNILEKKLRDGLLSNEEKILKGLISYVCEEILFGGSSKEFRKNLLTNSDEEAQAFFYIFELVEKIGKPQFLKALEEFYETNLFSRKEIKSFLNSLPKKYLTSTETFPTFENFSKLKLQGEVLLLKKEKDAYLLVLGVTKSRDFIGGMDRETLLEIKVQTKNKDFLFKRTLKRYYQLFEFVIPEEPENIYLDPNYVIWREMNPGEKTFSIRNFLKEKGVVLCSFQDVYVYKRLIEKLKSRGYEIWMVEDPSKSIPERSLNLIYLNSFPYPWLINLPEKGFYIKILPNDVQQGTFLGFVFSSSFSETEKALRILPNLENYTEVLLSSEKIISVRGQQNVDGVRIFSKNKLFGYFLRKSLEPKEVSVQVLNVPVVLIGEGKGNFEKFYQEFLEELLVYNHKILVTLDLPASFQTLIDLYLQNKIQKSLLLSELNKQSGEISLETIDFILDFAKSKGLRVLTIGVEEHLFKRILDKGILSLTQEEIQKLPEVDLANTLLERFLYEKYQEKVEKYPFENFYQAYLVKNEALTENLLKIHRKFPDHQILVITNKEQLISNSGLARNLEIKNLFRLKRIILDFEFNIPFYYGDYLFSEAPKPR